MQPTFNRISVVGLGYIGLPTAAIIASRNVEVIGVDVSEKVVNTINQGKIHIIEPDLDILVRATVQTGKLKAVVKPEPADAFLIAVPTPLTDDKTPDLSYVFAAAKSIAPVLEKGNLVILESTSPVGTTEQMVQLLAETRQDLSFPHTAGEEADIQVAYCPERVLPGKVLRELVDNDRIMGGITPVCAERAADLYRIFVQGECFLTDSRTAEMSKVTENAYRDANIAFANELSMICDEININVWELIKLANRHPRVNILSPGPGVGGHCIPIDPWFIVDRSPKTARMIRCARNVNDSKFEYVLEKIITKAKRFREPNIAILGLTFKPDIDDMRESPALMILKRLASSQVGAIFASEPNINILPEDLSDVSLCPYEQAIAQSDIVAVLVKHKQFANIDRSKLKDKIVLDFVNAF